MKIRAKITLFTALMLIAVVVLVTLLSSYNIKKQGDADLAAYEQQSVAAVKEHLKDLVDVAYTTIDTNYSHLSDVGFLSTYYDRRLNGIVDSGDQIIKRYQALVARGSLSLREAKNRAKNEIKKLRFDGGTGYIWINDFGLPFPTMIMHPTVPDLDGEVLNDPSFNNAMGIGKNLFQAFVEVTKNSSEGYVDYLWPKPTKDGLSKEPVPKVSYVRRFNEWGWILGTGIYIDDARVEIEKNIMEAIKSMRYAGGTGYFWINDNVLPYPTMIMHPTVPSLDGEVLDDPKFDNARGVDQNLFQAFAEVTKADGSGFVDYLWPKPTATGLTARQPKISFVKLHRPTGWIIGSGVYVDGINEDIEARRREVDAQIKQMVKNNAIASAMFLVLVVLLAYVFANTFSKPIRKLSRVAEQISMGKDLDVNIEEASRSDEIGEMAKSIGRLKISTKIMLSRLAKKQKS